MTVIEINKRYYSIATSWNELTLSQLLRVVEVLNSNATVVKAHLKLIYILTGISWLRFLFANTDQLSEYFYITDFFISSNDLNHQLLPFFRGRYGPAADFDNLRGKEFAYTEAFFEEYMSTNRERELDSLIAVLYRPARLFYNKRINRKGDIRRPFNHNILGTHAGRIHKWPARIKQAILAWYIGSRQNLIQNNPKVFGGRGGNPSLYGMWSTMRAISEKGNHGNFAEVENMLVKEIMMELNELIHEAERLEKASK